MRRKTGCLVLLLLVGSLLLGGCRAGEETKEEAAQREKIVLWSYYETQAQCDALDELMEGFNLSQEKYEASWEYVPMTEFTKRLSMAYTENALPDMALIDNPDMVACIQMDMFADITPFLEGLKIKELYYPALLETVTYEGRMYGLPFNCNNVALIYNVEMLKEKNLKPPKTWEELEQAAKVLTTEDRSGFLMSAVEGEQGAFQILPWILSAGEKKEEIGSQLTVRAFSYLNNLIKQGYMDENCINLSQTDVARTFVKGGAAMMENGPWVFPLLEEAGIDYGVSFLPVDKKSSVIVGGENLGILKGKNLEGGQAFLAYYDRDSVMKKFCKESSVIPTKKDIVLNKNSENEKLYVFQEQMNQAVVRTGIPYWNTLSVQLSKAVYEMVSGEKDPRQAAEMLSEH